MLKIMYLANIFVLYKDTFLSNLPIIIHNTYTREKFILYTNEIQQSLTVD